MTKHKTATSALSRRGFLKATAAAAGTASAAAFASPGLVALAEEEATGSTEEQVIKGRCLYGGCLNCERLFTIRDNHIVNTRPSLDAGAYGRRPCQRGINYALIPYYPDRIKYPMKRVEGTERGAGQWERISWDEAMAIISEKLNGYIEEFGPASIAESISSGTYGLVGGFSMVRLYNLMGFTTFDISVDAALGVGHDRVWGSYKWYPTHNLWAEEDLYNAKTIMVWGENISESYVQRWRHFIMAKRNGAKLIVIDPNYTNLAQRATKWYSVRPGSDPALMLAMGQVIVEEGLHDTDFIMRESAGAHLVNTDTGLYLRYKDTVTLSDEDAAAYEVVQQLGQAVTYGMADEEQMALYGEAAARTALLERHMVWDNAINEAVPVDEAADPSLHGTHVVAGAPTTTSFDLLVERLNQYTPESVAEDVGLSPEDIRDLARAAADGPVTQCTGYGAQAYDNGVQVGWGLAMLLALTGNLGKPGAGISQNQLIPDTNYAYYYGVGSGPNLSFLEFCDIMETGKHNGEDYPIKAYIICGASTLGGSADYNRVLAAMDKVDFVVNIGITYNDNAKYADIVLPAVTKPETEELLPGTYDCDIAYTPQLVKESHEAKQMHEIARLFAEGLGVGEQFTSTPDEIMAMALDTETNKAAGITLERIKEEKSIRYRDPDNSYLRSGVGWTTSSGKLEFWCEAPSPRMATSKELTAEDMDHLPSFTKPIEAWPGTEAMGKYPLVLNSARARYRWHTDGYSSPWLNELEPEPFVRCNPADAETRGLADGDYVELYNDRGNAVVKLSVDAAVRPGLLTYPKGFEQQQFKKGTFSALTTSYCNPVHVNTSFFDCCVEMRKWED